MDRVLQRDDVSAARSYGVLRAAGLIRPLLQTLEPGANDNARNRSSIPAKSYTCTLRFSERHGYALFGVDGVEDRSDIEIHVLNYVFNPDTQKQETDGCIGVGLDRRVMEGEDAIGGSLVALNGFMMEQGVPHYRTLTTKGLVDDFIAKHPQFCSFTLTVLDPPATAAGDVDPLLPEKRPEPDFTGFE